MKIRLLSDLHTEFRLPYKTLPFSEYRGEDALVLAGDIASGSTNTMNVIRWFLDQGFPKVLYVPGNHEYYGTDYDSFNDKMQDKCAKVPGAYFLNPGSVELDGVVFVGGTLWTNFNKLYMSEVAALQFISDFKYIKGFTTLDARTLYDQHLEYIQQQYEQRQGRRVVVITHFLPARECISPRFRGANPLNDYFANDLGSWIETLEDTTWLFGHTHDHVDITLGKTRLVCNPHGYYTADNDGLGFNPYRTVEV